MALQLDGGAMVGLAHKLNQIVSVSQLRKDDCPVGQLIDSLDKEDADALRSALESSASTRSIHGALRAESYRVDRGLLSLHRKGFCRCKEVIDE